MTVEVSSEAEAWAVEQGYHTPAQVRTGHLLIELLENWPEVYNGLQAALETNPAAKIAIQHEAHVSRDGLLCQQIAQALTLSDDTVNEIFRAAYLRRL
jgi:response regulator RpfG family c-di-GMP phosphodiesterase